MERFVIPRCAKCGREVYRCDQCCEKQLRIAQHVLAVIKKELIGGEKAYAEILKIWQEACLQKMKVVDQEIETDRREAYLQTEVDEELGAREREFYRKFGAKAWKKKEQRVRKQIEKRFRKRGEIHPCHKVIRP